MKDLLIGVILGAMAILLLQAFAEIKRLNEIKQDKNSIIIIKGV